MTNDPHKDEASKALVTLHSCPPGLFRFGETIGFKTEYGMTICDDNGAEMPGHLVRFKVSNYPDAYVLESGEVFWGGTKSHAERSGLLVEPLTLAALSQPQHGGLVEAVARFLQMWDLDASGHALKGAVNNLRAALASNSPVVGEDAPVAWVSPGQFETLKDPEAGEGGGAYLPVRKSKSGNFTMPLYAKPTPTDTADRSCTCHPDDRPEGPCPQKFAAGECTDTAVEQLEETLGALEGKHGDGGIRITMSERRLFAKLLREHIASLIAVPDGMVLVPREPTEAMLCAWATSDKVKDDWRADCRSGWSAMIAAATGEA